VHGPLGEQLEDGGADVAALAPSASAATTAARTVTEAEAATGVEAELEAASAGAEAAARTEGEPVAVAGVAERAAVAGVLLAQVVTQMVAELAAGLPALLMEGTAVAGAEAEAESTRRWCEWVAHM